MGQAKLSALRLESEYRSTSFISSPAVMTCGKRSAARARTALTCHEPVQLSIVSVTVRMSALRPMASTARNATTRWLYGSAASSAAWYAISAQSLIDPLPNHLQHQSADVDICRAL